MANKIERSLAYLFFAHERLSSGSKQLSKSRKLLSSYAGGGVWKSNPPFRSLRTESPALKAGEITGPLSPPGEV